MILTALLLSRLQFAFTITFHIILKACANDSCGIAICV